MYFHLWLFLLFLSLGSTEKNLDPSSLFASSIYTHQYTFIHTDSPPKPLFSRLENPSSPSLSWCVRCSTPLIILVDLSQAHSRTSISNKHGLWPRVYAVCMQCKKPALFRSHLFWPFSIPAGIVARECFRKDLHVVKCMDSHCFEECLQMHMQNKQIKS